MAPGKSVVEIQSDRSNGDDIGKGRSYECTFCRRGFTNAQALGGHMNIHRKDKVKVKQKNQEESSSIRSNSRYLSPQDKYHRNDEPQVHYQVYFPSQNPSFQEGNAFADWSNTRPEYLYDYQMDYDNPSLGMGLNLPVDEEDRGKRIGYELEENGVDLELRLGYE